MHRKSSKRVLLVGATGYIGRELARRLLYLTDVTVILAGRSRAKLEDLRASLDAQDAACQLDLLELDANRISDVALPEFDVLINATADGPHNAPLIQACLKQGADWIDLQMSNELLQPSSELLADIERADCRFVIQAGFHPGMLAALVRHAAQQLDVTDKAIVSSVIRDQGGLPYSSGFTELVESFKDYKSEMYKDGRWEKLKYGDYPEIAFGHGFGELLAYPVEMPELRRLPALLPELRDTGFFVAGFNWFADYLVTPLIMLSAAIAPTRTPSALGHLLSWSTRKFSRPPFGTVIQVQADGQHNGQLARFQLSLYHEDAYVLTAIPTVAMVKQMLHEDMQPGVHLMGLCCDPTELLADIDRMGIPATQHLEFIRST